MIYITGDTHGDWMSRLKTDSFPQQKEMTKDDYVIICGDFGIWDNSEREKYNLDWLEDKPFTTLFVSGNHENYDILDSLPVEEWHGGKVNFVRPSVIHLMRGQVFEVDGKKFFTFGGASSHDVTHGILDPNEPDFNLKKKKLDRNPFALYRINHVSWWERELPNKGEMEEGRKNLAKHGNEVDYVITHSPYRAIINQVDSGLLFYKQDALTDYLQDIKATTLYKAWYFGHLHIEREFVHDKSTCLYKSIVRIDEDNT